MEQVFLFHRLLALESRVNFRRIECTVEYRQQQQTVKNGRAEEKW